MPAMPPVAKVLKVIMKGQLNADLNCVNILYFKYATTAPTDIELQTFGNLVLTEWGDDFAGQVGSQYQLQHIQTIDLTSSTAAEGVSSGTPQSGTDGGTDLAAGTALVISQRIQRRYRGGHPRVYIAGMTSAALNTSQAWTAATVANVQAAWVNFITGVIAGAPAGWGGIQQVNVSYWQGFTNHTYPSGRVRAIPNPRPGGPITDPIIDYVVNPKVASQRRRNLQSA